MAQLKLVRTVGTITASTMGDDAAHSLDCGTLTPFTSLRVSEVGGQDAFVKITEAGTAVTSSNGVLLKANSTILLSPDSRPDVGEGFVVLDGTDSSSSNAGDTITLESGNDTTGSTALFLDRGENNFTLSAINETSGSDAGIQVEVVSQVSSM
tara:strand:+ start:128 stop:586 length:459 start_codon:yes stop_codon:yes gene_type:complete